MQPPAPAHVSRGLSTHRRPSPCCHRRTLPTASGTRCRKHRRTRLRHMSLHTPGWRSVCRFTLAFGSRAPARQRQRPPATHLRHTFRGLQAPGTRTPRARPPGRSSTVAPAPALAPFLAAAQARPSLAPRRPMSPSTFDVALVEAPVSCIRCRPIPSARPLSGAADPLRRPRLPPLQRTRWPCICAPRHLHGATRRLFPPPHPPSSRPASLQPRDDVLSVAEFVRCPGTPCEGAQAWEAPGMGRDSSAVAGRPQRRSGRMVLPAAGAG